MGRAGSLRPQQGASAAAGASLRARCAAVALLPAVLALGLLAACGGDTEPAPSASGAVSQWPEYGNDPGGSRYVALTSLAPENVSRLRVAWTARTGDVSDGRGEIPSTTAFEATPILVDGTLYVCSPMNRVLALDPATGAERWQYDPEIDLTGRYANQLVCRGVTHWRDPEAQAGATCAARIFTATNDSRLVALDAATGTPCAGFGEAGEVDLLRGVGEIAWRGEYQVTSPPVVARGLVVVGSAIGDNQRTTAPSGVVRAFDARTGALRWAWDLAPPDLDRTTVPTAGESGWVLGTPNVWAPMSVDEARGLVFVPTGNPAPDYTRIHNRRLDHYGSSVVALRAETGEVAWRFQTVHHDLWDYDVPAQPTLVDVVRNGRRVPGLVQTTKMGMLFVLDRTSGRPLFPVEERPVPQDGAPGEVLSPTQPFPVRPPPLVRHRLVADEAWGITPLDRRACRRRMEALRHDGIYTPPTLQGSVMVPGNAGGSNWGGVAVDPERQLVVANVSDVPWTVRLFPSERFAEERAAHPGVEVSPQRGEPYGLVRELLVSPLGLPCSPPPWGTLAAVDLGSGEIRWQVPLGTVRDIAPVPIPWKAGVPNLGGPVVTRSGLVLIAAAMDDYLRAFDLETGRELWKGRLPAGGQATPMVYEIGGRPYVVIAAGGHGRATTTLGDFLVAFTLFD